MPRQKTAPPEKPLQPGIYLNSIPDKRHAELMLVADDGDCIVQPLTVTELRELASNIRREASRLKKGLPETNKHTPAVLEAPDR